MEAQCISNLKFQYQATQFFSLCIIASIYTIPGSMPHIGDKSDAYAQLRKDYDGMDLPKVEQRYNFKTMPMESDNKNAPDAYNIHNCPDHPPEGLLFRRRLSLFVIGISL